MRIGELAALVGVSARAVRHYHRLGLLPEPDRRPNGYREYGLRDAVSLARIRRLVDLGLSLADVKRAVGEDRNRGLRELLLELDADLAEQQENLRRRRERLALLLERDTLDPDDAVSDSIRGLLGAVPAGVGGIAERERAWLGLVDAMGDGATGAAVAMLADARAASSGEPALRGIYEALDRLVDASPDDPRVELLAAEVAAVLPPEFAAMLPDVDRPEGLYGDPHLAELLGELGPAQARVLVRALELIGA